MTLLVENATTIDWTDHHIAFVALHILLQIALWPKTPSNPQSLQTMEIDKDMTGALVYITNNVNSATGS